MPDETIKSCSLVEISVKKNAWKHGICNPSNGTLLTQASNQMATKLVVQDCIDSFAENKIDLLTVNAHQVLNDALD